MKKQKTSLVSKGIMVLLSLIVLVFISSYAWFAPSDMPAHASTLSVNTTSPPDFEIAVGFPYNYNNNYGMTEYSHDSFDLANLKDVKTNTVYSLFTNFSAKDITSDGVNSFSRPALVSDKNSADTKALKPSGGTGTPSTPGKEYLSFDLYFRSKTKNLTITLTDGSSVLAKCEGNSINYPSFTVTDAYDPKKSTYGNFSKDIVVGAVRTSFVGYESYSHDKTENYNLAPTLFWLPRPDIKLNTSDDTKNWTIDTNVPSTDVDNNTHTYWTLEGGAWTKHSYTSADSFFVSGPIDSNKNLVVLSTKDGEYYYNKIHVNLWIEGSDLEARRAISGGQFNFNLEFSAHIN